MCKLWNTILEGFDIGVKPGKRRAQNMTGKDVGAAVRKLG
jgi:hypothetical protein